MLAPPPKCSGAPAARHLALVNARARQPSGSSARRTPLLSVVTCPGRTHRGRSAKAVAVSVLEPPVSTPPLVSRLEHAAYLGRELARAELALATGADYIQD
jgi:hypothetical protein